MTEPQSGPLYKLACQCYLYITTSISSAAGWTSADLTALYGPEGLMVLLTRHVDLMLFVMSGNSGPLVETLASGQPHWTEKHDANFLPFCSLFLMRFFGLENVGF